MHHSTPAVVSLPLPTGGPLRVLSDFHLGHDMSTLRNVESLRGLIAGAGTVVFNGDTHQERGTAFRAKSDRLCEELRRLCAEEKAETVFLKGNHDPSAPGPDLLDLADGRVTVTHGDILLPLISPWSVQVREFRPVLEAIHAEYDAESRRRLEVRIEILQRCRAALPPSEMRQRGRSLKDLTALFFKEIWPPRRPWEVLKVWAHLPRMASDFLQEFRPRSEVMIFGHTHRPRVWRREGRLLVNTGAFVTFTRPLMVEIEGKNLSVFRLGEKAGQWRRDSRALAAKRLGSA